MSRGQKRLSTWMGATGVLTARMPFTLLWPDVGRSSSYLGGLLLPSIGPKPGQLSIDCSADSPAVTSEKPELMGLDPSGFF